MIRYRLLSFMPLLFLLACEKEDKPYILPPPGNIEQAEVTLGENYDTQVYFNLADKKQYSNQLKIWDLAFESGINQHMIWMNGGKQVQVFNTLSNNFTPVYSTTGISWQWDSPDGNLDSAAFRDWYNETLLTSSNFVYLIDRGPDAPLGRYKKLQVQQVDAQAYQFRFANLDGSEEKAFTLLKDTNTNYSYFSFDDGGKAVSIEPGKNKYDILFTRYRYIYYDLHPFLPYSVNGVLLNPNNTFAAADSITPFDSIDYAFATTMSFSSKYDAIGFDWKAYNFTTSIYEVNRAKCYVIKNREGIYYKLRFIDFYSSQGIKGSPEFEFQRL